MAEKAKTPLEILNEWKGVVTIGLLLFGAYFWLERNYARVEKLAAEKCSLSYEIRLTKADLEFTKTDEEIDLQRSELEDLLELANPPQERVAFKRGFIASLDKRLSEIDARMKCLRRAKDRCFQDETTTDSCYDLEEG